jgi:hypothetical protein
MTAVYTTDLSLLQRETTPGGGTYTTIPQCSVITPPEWKRKSASINIMDQTAPITKYGGGEAMEMTADLAWDPTNSYHQQLFADYTAKTSRSYQIVLSDTGAAQFRFDAVIGGLKPDALDAEGKILKLTVTLALAADPTITW